MICSFASSGMMFDLVPAWKEPTVTTAGSSGFNSREMMVCSRSTVLAAMTMGSIEACGLAPCDPRPWMVTSTVSTLAKAGPGTMAMLPLAMSGVSWRPTAKSGLGHFW